MGHVPYDQDFFAWSQHQAEVLRTLSRRRSDLPNDLDLDNIAEEIEDMGRSELRAVESLIRLILGHLIKAAAAPTSPAVSHWRSEVLTWQNDLLSAYTPAMRHRLDLDLLWRRAVREASARLEEYGDTVPSDLPPVCPIGLDLLLDDAFDPAQALEALNRERE